MTFLWYDIETFGKYPLWDRIAQFAAIRTNDKFEILEEPTVLYCKPSPDYIPDPQSCLITGITPDICLEKGLNEYDFISKIQEIMSVPSTCTLGYNNLRFDDEFIRACLYRNFHDPYTREWANGNSRWDILDLMRITHDLRPEGICWPKDENEKTTYRLEKLCKANQIEHINAHDALSDVKATIGLAKLVQEKQSRLFQYMFRIRKKEELRPLLNIHTLKPLLHTSGMFTSEKGCTTIVSPIGVDPKNRNCIYCFDLRNDPSILAKLSPEEIKNRIFTSGTERIPIKGIHVNKCPAIAPLGTLTKECEQNLGLNKELCMKNLKILQSIPQLSQKITKVFSFAPPAANPDPELQLYSGGFFHDKDKEIFESIHTKTSKVLFDFTPDFSDSRLPEMFWRFKCRNYPKLLSSSDSTRYRSFCASRLLFPPFPKASDMGEFNKRLKAYRDDKDLSPLKISIIKKLSEYSDFLKESILEYKD